MPSERVPLARYQTLQIQWGSELMRTSGFSGLRTWAEGPVYSFGFTVRFSFSVAGSQAIRLVVEARKRSSHGIGFIGGRMDVGGRFVRSFSVRNKLGAWVRWRGVRVWGDEDVRQEASGAKSTERSEEDVRQECLTHVDETVISDGHRPPLHFVREGQECPSSLL